MMLRFSTAAAALCLTGLAVLGAQAPVSAQEDSPGNPGQGSERCVQGGNPNYPPDQEERVSPSRVERGERTTATSGCREFAPGQRVAFGVESVFQQLGTAIASADGEVAATFTVPTNLTDGQHHVVFKGTGFDGQPNEVRIPFVVNGGRFTGTGAGAGTGAGSGTVNVGGVQLPRTGSDELVPLLVLGAGLVVAGGSTVMVARRRRGDLSPIA